MTLAHWDYRLVRQLVENQTTMTLHEVYYDAEDRVTGWTAQPATLQGETYWEVAEAIALAGDAICCAVLDVTGETWVWCAPGIKAAILGPAR